MCIMDERGPNFPPRFFLDPGPVPRRLGPRWESETLAGWGEFIVCLRLTPGPPNWPFLKRLDSVGRRRVLEEVAIGLLGWTPDGGGYEYRDWVEIPWPGYSWQDRLRRLQAVTSGLLTEVRTVRSELRGVSYDGRPVTFEEALAVLHRPDQESSLPRFSVDESVPSAEGRLLTDELFEAVTTTAWDEAVKVMGEQDAVPELPGWPTGASPRGFAWIVRQYIRDVARALARVEHSRIIDGPPTSDQRQCLPAALAHRPVIQVPQEVADLVASPGPSAESLPHSVHRPDGPGDRRTWTFWWGGTPYSLTELRWKLLSALWDGETRQPKSQVYTTDLYRAIYGERPEDRRNFGKLYGLVRDLNIWLKEQGATVFVAPAHGGVRGYRLGSCGEAETN